MTKFSFSNRLTQGKVIANIAWLLFDKFFRLGVGLLIVMWLARYLGPEQFGILNYAGALVAVFGVIAALGLKGIVVRDLTNSPEQANNILGTAFTLKFIAALAIYILLIFVTIWLNPNDEVTTYIVAILGLTMLFKSAEVVHFWFESQVQSKYVVWAENGTFAFIAVIKIIMLWQQVSLIAFAYVMLFEAVCISAALLTIYAKNVQSPFQWQATKAKAKSLLKDSWPLIISSAAWIIYTRIDQIMIGQMLDQEAVGYYSAAIRLSEIVNFLPPIIAFSIIPTLAALRYENNTLYLKRFQATYDLSVGMMIVAAVVTTFLGSWIVQLLFGSEYSNAATVLVIHIWSAIFIAMATVSGRFLIYEGLQKVTMQRHLLGVALNIPLNFFMIPLYGIEGAAFASLISLAISNYFYDAISANTRICFIQKSKSLIAYSVTSRIWTKKHDH